MEKKKGLMENFKKSESIKEISKALIEFKKKVKVIKKTAVGVHGAKYTPLNEVLDEIKDPLESSELSFSQFPCGSYGLTTILMHVSGEWMESYYEIKPIKSDPQGIGSVITYQRRYAITSILGLSGVDDDDADSHVVEERPSKTYAKQESLGQCKLCDYSLIKSPKTGKIFCSDKCWLKKQ